MRSLHAGRRAGTKPHQLTTSTRRGFQLGAVLIVSVIMGVACSGAGAGGEAVEEITVDWAYYNPVSLVLKEKGWLEEELDGVQVNWVQSAGSNKALEFLAAKSIQFGSSAGAAALLATMPGKAGAAFELAANARKAMPGDAELAQTLAVLGFQRKEYPSVIQLLTESKEARPLTPELLCYEGLARIQLKQVEEGKAVLTKALDAGVQGDLAAQARAELAK